MAKSRDYVKLYYDEHIANRKTISQLASEIGMSISGLRHGFERNGLTPVDHRHKDYSAVRVTAFDTWSAEMAYWLGFIAADGSLSSRSSYFHIKLSLRDRVHLEKLRGFLNLPEFSLVCVTDKCNGKEIVQADLGCSIPYLHKRLTSLGIEPQKSTKDIDFLSHVPEEFKVPFILGYFDGDGSFADGSQRADGSRRDPVVNFVGSFSFLDSVRDFLIFRCGMSGAVVSKCYDKRLYSLTFKGIRNAVMFARMHAFTLGDLPLERKLASSRAICSYSVYRKCTSCGIPITRGGSTGLCADCQSFTTRKVSRPSAEELSRLLTHYSYVSLGKMFGVSDNAVRKWAKGYGLI